jgi:hypothetical protein
MQRYWVQYATEDGNGDSILIEAASRHEAQAKAEELPACIEVLEVSEE